MSVNINVSHKSFDRSCDTVVAALARSGVATAFVVPGVALDLGKTENACAITLSRDIYSESTRLAALWDKLSARLDLTCAFLRIDGVYAGCILNYIRPSLCPPALARQK